MTPERWREIQALFDAAVDRAPDQRSAFLRDACGEDAALCAEVEALLRADAVDASVLDTTADRALGLAATSDVGARVGPYELLHVVGAGGMGEVFLARRVEGGFEQRVAIKLIRADAGSEQVLRRFNRERQILAQLSHPNIARLFDGGATEDGRPYFVMEHVDGERLHDHCRQHGVALADRLRLMIDVCAAVHHAHRSLVIHRDLKPDNILVTADGTVKLLDFGIAQVLDPERGVAVAITDPRHRVLTPQYAAPEQMRGEAITTATDVYALGVLLYELVARALPYSTKGVPASQLERIICGTAIAPPSRVASGEPVSRALDAVCLRALARAPEQRYASAAELGATLEELLAPVHRCRRWSAVALALALALVLAMIVGFAVGRWTS